MSGLEGVVLGEVFLLATVGIYVLVHDYLLERRARKHPVKGGINFHR